MVNKSLMLRCFFGDSVKLSVYLQAHTHTQTQIYLVSRTDRILNVLLYFDHIPSNLFTKH